MNKTSISDAQLKDELIKLFESGVTGKYGKTGIFGIIRERYTIAKDRYKNLFDIALLEWQGFKEKAQGEQIHASTIEGLKRGLKSKLARQQELEDMLKPDFRIESAALSFKTGQVVRYFRVMEPKEIIAVHQELSKMAGEYAPAKVATTDTEGKDKEIVFSDSQVDKILDAIKDS